jgi:hypothetical protein
LAEGWVFLPMKAFGKSTLAFFLDLTDECTPAIPEGDQARQAI